MGKEAIKVGKKSDLVRGHEQVRIQYKDLSAKVDKGIAKLILAMWRCGIETQMSCEENSPGVTWVSFRRVADLQRLMRLMADWSGFEWKIGQAAWSISDVAKFGRWHSKVDIVPGWRWVGEDEIVLNGTVKLSYSIRFPKKDMVAVIRHLKTKEKGYVRAND